MLGRRDPRARDRQGGAGRSRRAQALSGGHTIALDGGTSCGWAIVRWQDARLVRVDSGAWNLAPLEGEADGARFLRLWKRLDELAPAAFPIDLVALERPGHYRAWQTTQVCYGISAFVQAWCWRHRLPLVLVGPTEIKQLATGRGRASKEETTAAALRLFGHAAKKHDEAEALLVAHVACVST